MQFHSGYHKDDKGAEQEAEQVNKYLSPVGMGLSDLVKTPGNKTYPTHHRLGGAPHRTRKARQIAEIYQWDEVRRLSQDLNFKLNHKREDDRGGGCIHTGIELKAIELDTKLYAFGKDLWRFSEICPAAIPSPNYADGSDLALSEGSTIAVKAHIL
ncbi:MAG: hypothetical protein Q9221_006812 [Calogaya cf. arnoldii]